MEVKNVILHFPWGAGGNFIRNCLLLDCRYEFDWSNKTLQQRYQYLVQFYQSVATQENWLNEEWHGPRGYLYSKYYKNQTIHFSNTCPVIFVSHCEEEVPSLVDHNSLSHVFLNPSDKQFIAKIYVSKSPTTDGHLRGSTNERIKQTLWHLGSFEENQIKLKEELIKKNTTTYTYDVNKLFNDDGHLLIQTIAQHLSVEVPMNMGKNLHQLWNGQNKKLYNALFAQEKPEWK